RSDNPTLDTSPHTTRPGSIGAGAVGPGGLPFRGQAAPPPPAAGRSRAASPEDMTGFISPAQLQEQARIKGSPAWLDRPRAQTATMVGAAPPAAAPIPLRPPSPSIGDIPPPPPSSQGGAPD